MATEALAISDIDTYYGDSHVLHGVSFSLQPGRLLGLLGRVPRDVTIVMIEHDMDSALAFAERITLLHYGEVIVEGTRAQVVADPRTKEVYLGD